MIRITSLFLASLLLLAGCKSPDRVLTNVKYTQNYMSRTIVDFDSGSIMVETLDDKAPKESLKNAIVTTLLTPGCGSAVRVDPVPDSIDMEVGHWST